METNLEGPDGSSIKTGGDETVIKGPSGEIRVGGGEGGAKEGDTLSPEKAQEIVNENPEYSIQDGNLIGPNGFKAKIGEELGGEQAKQLANDAPQAAKGNEDGKSPGDGTDPPKTVIT